MWIAFIVIVLLTLGATVAYYVSVFNAHQPENAVSAVSPAPTSIPTPSPSASPTPAPNASQVQTPLNPLDIKISTWNETSESDKSLVVIDSPTNNAVYSTHSVTLTVHAGAPSWSYMINLILDADWLENSKSLFYHLDYWPGHFYIAEGISATVTLADIPEGNHTITVTANRYTSIQGSSSVNFTIDSSNSGC